MSFHASSGFPTASNLYSLPLIAGSLIPHGVGSLIPNARCNLVRSISSSITKGGSKLGLYLVMKERPCAHIPGYFALRLQGLSPACWQKKCNPRNARTKGKGSTACPPKIIGEAVGRTGLGGRSSGEERFWALRIECWRVWLRSEQTCQGHQTCTRRHRWFVLGLYRHHQRIVRRYNLGNFLLWLFCSH